MLLLQNFDTPAAFGENAAPALLDSDVTFTSASSLAGGRLTVSGVLADDRISVLDQGNGAGQIGVSGATISFGGTVIGQASGGVGGNFTVTFATQGVTAAAVDALIQRLAFANVSDTPTASRNLTIDVVDALGAGLGATFAAPAQLTGTDNPFANVDLSDTHPDFGFLPASHAAPLFIDIEGDGDRDLVLGNGLGQIRLYRNTGTDAAPTYVQNLDASEQPFFGFNYGAISKPSFVDLDGDGDLDFVAGSFAGTLRAHLNNGGSKPDFAFVELIGSANPLGTINVGAFSAPTFVDLDNDGDLDLVVGNVDGTLHAFANSGAATPVFTELTSTDNPFAGIDVGDRGAPTFVDLDGDGDLDLVVGHQYGVLRVFARSGPAATPVFTELTGTANPFDGIAARAFSAPTFADIDNDRDLDVMVGGQDGTVRTWRNNASTTTGVIVAVTVTAENDAPAITSANAATFAENGTGIAYQATATDADGQTITWSLGAEDDAALFDIDSMTGAVSFKVSPDFETKRDVDGDNVYIVEVIASDGTTSTSREVAITVTNVVGLVNNTPTSGHDLVHGGHEADTLKGGAGADTLNGGGGNDFIHGGPGGDSLHGGDGTDTLSFRGDRDGVTVDLVTHTVSGGHGAADTISGFENVFGGEGNDSITGDAVANRLRGWDGNDTLVGGEGADSLTGDEGNDSLAGGGGNDLLIGSAGADTLSGGLGDDVFLFRELLHSTAANPDVIADFDAGDRINVARKDANGALSGDQQFSFIGDAAFTAAGQLRAFQQGGNTHVEMNVNAGLGADAAIILNGLHTLVAGDFVL